MINKQFYTKNKRCIDHLLRVIIGLEAFFTGWEGGCIFDWGFILEIPLDSPDDWNLDDVPVLPTYFDWIFDGLIPPGLFIIFAHLGICL